MSKNGVLGTVSEKNGDETLPNFGYQQDMQPKLYFSNPDLLWAAAYHMPRLGQGGFQAALAGVFNQVTRAKLKRIVIGKTFALCALATRFARVSKYNRTQRSISTNGKITGRAT